MRQFVGGFMALVKRFVPINKDQVVRSEVECGYTISTVDGRKILRLETYGSPERKIPGKTSQNLQFDEASAQQLLTILRKAFPSLR
jgi:hypothetical protein